MNKNTRNWLLILLAITFGAHVAFWLVIQIFVSNEDTKASILNYFGATYGIVALLGGVGGLIQSKRWGGFSSHVGRFMSCISIGLLLTEFGQLAFSYFNIVSHIEIPYPSIADIGFFGAIPMYAIGAYYLMRTMQAGSLSKVFSSLKSAFVLLIPVMFVAIAYFVNFKDYDFGANSLLVSFLNIADPVGHVLYMSFALIALTRVRGLYGSLFKRPIILLIAGFTLQYVADLNFLFQDNNGTWVSGQYGDILYLCAYSLMVLGLFSIRDTGSMVKAGESTNG